MFETIMKLYVMAMAHDVRSPMPHLFGPPGCGKSTVVEKLADLLGVQLHTMSVARLSPLDVEGVQMPGGMDDPATAKLHMLTATFWTRLREGDIVLMDEFLRGFPEVYNALLDIFTSRRVGSFRLPKVFIIGASNSTVAYDKALEDRLLHITVPDPRDSGAAGKAAKREQAEHLVAALGLLPEMRDSMEMHSLLDTEVLPMYELLDSVKGKSSAAPVTLKGTSVRNLIGQALMREVRSPALRELISINNVKAMQQGKAQYVFLLGGKASDVVSNYEQHAKKLVGNSRLTEFQALNLDLNLQLIQMESIRNEKGGAEDDTADDLDDLFA